MVNKPLDMSNISKRRLCLDRHRQDNSDVRATLLGLQKANGSESYKLIADCFFKSCYNYEPAGQVLEQLYNDDKYSLLETYVTKTISDIIPCIEVADMQNCIDYYKGLNIGEPNVDRIVEAAKNYKTIDRILENHEKLSKRFTLEQMTTRAYSDRYKCELICELCDTYNLTPFVKMNIALEEMIMLNYRHGININRKSLVEYVTDYFLLRNENTKEDIDSYARCIQESKFLNFGDDERVTYLTRNTKSLEEGYGVPTWKDKIQAWKLDPNKSEKGLEEIFIDNLNNTTVLENVMMVYEEYNNINKLGAWEPSKVFKRVDSEGVATGIGAKNIINLIRKYGLKDCGDTVDNMRNTWIEDINGSIYEDHGDIDGHKTFTSSEIDKFKMHNLITDTQDIGIFLNQMKSAMKEAGIKTVPFASDIDAITESNVIDYLNEDGYILLKVGSYSYDPSVIDEAYELLNSAYKCAANMLYRKDSHPFYVIESDRANFYVRSKYTVSTSLHEDHIAGFPNSAKGVFVDILESVEHYQNIAESGYQDLIATLKDPKFASTVSVDEMMCIVDTIKPIDESGIITTLVENSKQELNPNYRRIKTISENTRFTFDVDVLDRINTCKEAIGLNEDAMGAITKATNTARLAWEALKSKGKQASAKDKEAARDLDNSFNHFIKSVDQATKVDRREQIIKGQIIPSFSKLLKLTLGLVGVGLVTGNPVIPAVGAIVALARSTTLTYKEKKMLLDEIDIELKVLDREVERASTSGSPNKYRQLLTIQRNLQKERLNIQYNMKKSGKGIPLNTTMMYHQQQQGGDY